MKIDWFYRTLRTTARKNIRTRNATRFARNSLKDLALRFVATLHGLRHGALGIEVS
jgi:hypothetical protein